MELMVLGDRLQGDSDPSPWKRGQRPDAKPTAAAHLLH